MKLDAKAKLTLLAILRALGQPETKYKLIANALTSNGEYWTALLISTPESKFDCADVCEVPQDIHEWDIEQILRENALAQVGEQHHSGFVYHSTDKEALLGLCHHLLLDAIFSLWSYSEALSNNTSIPQKPYTVKG